MRFPIILKKIIVLPLFLCIFFIACEEGDDDYSISEITIYNIPKKIKVQGSDPEEANDTFKVYMNASNSKAADVLPVAKGVAKITGDKSESDNRYTVKSESNDTYTVTMKLQKPNPKNGDDPTRETGPWSGTASFFLIVLSPQLDSDDLKDCAGVKKIWAKTGFTLDIGKERCNWKNDKIFINFRNPALSDAMGLDKKTEELFKGIVMQDPEIIKTEP